MTNNKDWSRWCKPGNKCKGCYTTRYVYYCITDHKGNKWESCEKCVDKLKEIRDGSKEA